jgi:hypothetical protein
LFTTNKRQDSLPSPITPVFQFLTRPIKKSLSPIDTGNFHKGYTGFLTSLGEVMPPKIVSRNGVTLEALETA